MEQPFKPYDTLKNRTFVGLIVSQFLAAFNDQAIHAAAMFFAIRKHTLSEENAIGLMPILFYAPWAIFCTLAGYFADRYSKRRSLVAWKVAEVAITLIALLGFWLGSDVKNPLTHWGPWIVLSTVFLMGTHSAFFVPAKYGVLPEILQPSLLSKGNGVLESTSFLAVILGTVSGGLLYFFFFGQEYYIGLILVALALIGTVASLMIRWMPPANPTRPFPGLAPWKLYQPLTTNLGTLLRSHPLRLAVMGIAFFTFMVAFMRQTMYMHGESQNPRWDEFQTSMVVSVVALGIGLGSPLAGSFSGGKIELGLVPLGAIGMILGTLFAGLLLHNIVLLIACLVLIGFFSGFYIVPMYTLLQHRAPKSSKGDLIATSNFINVTGAIAASLLFVVLVLLAKLIGLSRPIPVGPRPEQIKDVTEGRLISVPRSMLRRPIAFVIEEDDKRFFVIKASAKANIDKELERLRHARDQRTLEEHWWQALSAEDLLTLAFFEDFIDEKENILQVDEDLEMGAKVKVSKYALRGLEYYRVRDASTDLKPLYNNEDVPEYLFIGASLMTLRVLLLLWRQLPDFFVRTLRWWQGLGRYQIRVLDNANLPTSGPAILATNCRRFQESIDVLAATDRQLPFLLMEENGDEREWSRLRSWAKRAGLITLKAGAATAVELDSAAAAGIRQLKLGHLVGISINGSYPHAEGECLLDQLRAAVRVPVVPVYCGAVPQEIKPGKKQVRVIFGPALPAEASIPDIRQAIDELGRRLKDGAAGDPSTH